MDSNINQNQTFENFITSLLSQKKFKSYLKHATQEYDILKYKILNLTPQDIKKMYYRILDKHSQSTDSKKPIDNFYEENSWLINQLKIFVWIAICYAYQHDEHIGSLTHQGWKFLVSVFYFKPIEILQFQLLSLLKGESASQSRKWSHTQNELLKQIVSHPELLGKWNQISKLFFIKSGKKYFRKPQKCREHWNNHLNPQISHKPWSIQQDIQLIVQVKNVGKKWAQISMILGGRRTQHMVKNRYKSLEKKFQVEISESSKKQLQPQMLIQKENSSKEKLNNTELVKTASERTEGFQKQQMELEREVNINIQSASIEEEIFQEKKQSYQFSNINLESNLIEVSQEKFFVKTKRSLGFMSQIDDEIQRYVDSFLF